MVYLIGAGGHSKVVFDVAAASKLEVREFVAASAATSEYRGVPIRIDSQLSLPDSATAIIAIGDNKKRQKISEDHNWKYAVALHPSAIISPTARIGKGSVVMQGAVLQAQTLIGEHVIVNTAASVDHDCIIGDFAHIGPGSVLTGHVSVGEGTLIGAGVSIIPERRIGKWAVVGAGSVVISDIPDFAVAVGIPARVIKFVKP